MVQDAATLSLVFFVAVKSFDLPWPSLAVQGLAEVVQSRLVWGGLEERGVASSLRRSEAKTCVLRESRTGHVFRAAYLYAARDATRAAPGNASRNLGLLLLCQPMLHQWIRGLRADGLPPTQAIINHRDKKKRN
jgi:hypothetical protein